MPRQGDMREKERPDQCVERDTREQDCPECARLKSKLKWCQQQLYGWAEFRAFRDSGPFGRDVGEDEKSYFDIIDLNIGDI